MLASDFQTKSKQRKILNIYFYLILAKKLPKNVTQRGVFAANELDLEEVNIYGFDYDYTIACYKKSLNYLLYNLGRDNLIERYKVKSFYLEMLNKITNF